MSAGKREAESEGFDLDQIPFKKIAIIVAIVIVVILAVVFAVHTINTRKETNEVNTNSVEENTDNSMPEKYEGYKVLGELVIEKINLDKYIVDSKEDDAMAKAPAKLYGTDVNTIGNLCLAGHNYEEVFARLNELVVGDEFYIVDTEETIQDYKVTEILQVEPTDLKILMPVQDKMQVTLITCIEGATQRLVVRAERVQTEE